MTAASALLPFLLISGLELSDRTGPGAALSAPPEAEASAPGATVVPPAPAANDALDVSRYIEIHATLQSLFLFRSDSDFDTAPPLYDENGQTVGAAATLFTPSATWHIMENLRLFYEAELGLNYWSKNNPDQQAAIAPDLFVFKHRQIYGEGELAVDFWGLEKLGFRVGYMHFRDTTGLFLAHWIGAARVAGAWSNNGRVELFVGQVPDQTYEGINVMENNFKRDILVFGASTQLRLADWIELKAGVHGLYDSHLVDQTRWLVVPNAHLSVQEGIFFGTLDAVLQVGASEGETATGAPQVAVAWAAQGHVDLAFDPVRLELNALALSPDDAYAGNEWNHAFLSSGKNKSATVMLTEDELRDWYDNFDERMSTFRGGFFMNRAGLFVADAKIRHEISELFDIAAVVGVATVLKPENALGGAFVGLEGDVIFTVKMTDHLRLDLAVAGMLPGDAGAAKINRIRRHATDPLGMAEASFVLVY